MTITNNTIRTSTNGNGVTTAFAVSFPFYDDADLVVILVRADETEVVQVLNSDYTVAGGGGTSGTVTMIVPPASGERLVRYRVSPLTQETDYADGDAFPADSHEAALDRLTMQNQEQADKLSRALTLSESTEVPGSLTMDEPIAGRALKWNATEDGIVNSNSDIEAVEANVALNAAAAEASTDAAAASAAAAAASASVAATNAGTAALYATGAGQTLVDATNYTAGTDNSVVFTGVIFASKYYLSVFFGGTFQDWETYSISDDGTDTTVTFDAKIPLAVPTITGQWGVRSAQVAFTDVASTPTTLAGYGITDAATSTQGGLADSALQPGDAIDNSVIGGSTPAAGTFTTLRGDAGSGVGIAPTDGTLHVHTASAGTVTASANGDELVLENNGNAGLSILTPNTASATIYFGDADSAGVGYIGYTHSTNTMSFQTNEALAFYVDGNRNKVLGNGALATTATDGFTYIPASAGAPTGTPTSVTGMVPMHFDSTNNVFYIYNGGWKSVAMT
ncbi:MAG: hypothetical protein HQ483_18395 [Rhodospirillales bacterium]|nr:hypothetical protein [Rhodospirillales bacterium]